METIHKAITGSIGAQLPAPWGIRSNVICLVHGNQFRPDVGGWNPPPPRMQAIYPLVHQCPPPLLWIEVTHNLGVLHLTWALLTGNTGSMERQRSRCSYYQICLSSASMSEYGIRPGCHETHGGPLPCQLDSGYSLGCRWSTFTSPPSKPTICGILGTRGCCYRCCSMVPHGMESPPSSCSRC